MLTKFSVLIDLDGVLRIGKAPADGLKQFVDFLLSEKINFCIVSNTTLSTSSELKRFFVGNGIQTDIPMLTASEATHNYVKANYSTAAVYCIDKIKKVFSDIITNGQPDVVVLGDMGDKWDYNLLNDIFRKVKAGADIVAMQKNRFWSTPEDGYLLDAGPFVKAIEFASGKDAVVIGKPSKIYFDSALKLIGASIDRPFVMIGDDVETDIGAAQSYGGTGVLIYTGKTEYPLADDFHIKPDYEAKNLEEVMNILISLGG